MTVDGRQDGLQITLGCALHLAACFHVVGDDTLDADPAGLPGGEQTLDAIGAGEPRLEILERRELGAGRSLGLSRGREPLDGRRMLHPGFREIAFRPGEVGPSGVQHLVVTFGRRGEILGLGPDVRPLVANLRLFGLDASPLGFDARQRLVDVAQAVRQVGGSGHRLELFSAERFDLLPQRVLLLLGLLQRRLLLRERLRDPAQLAAGRLEPLAMRAAAFQHLVPPSRQRLGLRGLPGSGVGRFQDPLLAGADPGFRAVDLDVQPVDALRCFAESPVGLFEELTPADEIGLDPRESGGRLRFRVPSGRLFLTQSRQFGIQRPRLLGESYEFALAQFVPQPAIATRLGGLPLERIDLALDLDDDVVHAKQIRLGRLEFQLGQSALVLVARDARRILDQGAAVLRFRVQDLVDLALLDRRVGPCADPALAQHLLDVFQPGSLAVQPILGVPATVDATRHGEGIAIRHGDPFGAAEDERDLGHPQRFA